MELFTNKGTLDPNIVNVKNEVHINSLLDRLNDINNYNTEN